MLTLVRISVAPSPPDTHPPRGVPPWLPTIHAVTLPGATPRDRLRDLGLTLPPAPAAVASYVPVNVVPLGAGRALVAVSGQLPLRDGRPVATGRVPDEVSLAVAQDCARVCALNILAQLDSAVGLDSVEKIVHASVFVRCADDYTGQPQVANATSELLVDVLGESGRHARAAVGVNALPLGVPIEVAVLAVARIAAVPDDN